MNEGGPDSQLREAGENPAMGLEQDCTSHESGQNREALPAQVARLVAQIHILNGQAVECPIQRDALQNTVHSLAELSQTEDHVKQLVEGGAVDAVVPLLTLFAGHVTDPASPSGEHIEEEACLILIRLSMGRDQRKAIADRGALPGLVGLLKRYVSSTSLSSTRASLVQHAAIAIQHLAFLDDDIASRVGLEGGIPPLVALLDSSDPEVQEASAAALQTLSQFNKDNKSRIVECGGLPPLIRMLKDDYVGSHDEAVGVLVNIVDGSSHNVEKVLDEGGLQPIIGLLFTKHTDSLRREAAELLGHLSNVDSAFVAVQLGAVPPLIDMLGATNDRLKFMALYALGNLALEARNRAGIVQAGALPPLLQCMASHDGNVRWHAADTLFSLAQNDDNVDAIIREGGVQCLLDFEVPEQDPPEDAFEELAERMRGKVLLQTLDTMASSDKLLQRRTAIALAYLAREEDLRTVFVDRKGLDILLSTLTEPEQVHRIEAAGALFELAETIANAALPCAADVNVQQVYLAPQYVNNPLPFDVTFVVEGRNLHAHRATLRASSDTFRAMFDGPYRDSRAAIIHIPNMRYVILEAMMRYIYTGSVEVTLEIAQELLLASDQYLLEGLKRLCEGPICSALSVENFQVVFELAESVSALQLSMVCVLFALVHFRELAQSLPEPALLDVLRRMVPKLEVALIKQLTKEPEGL